MAYVPLIMRGCIGEKNLRVLYSFPHKLGGARICHTAWQQVNGIAEAGAHVLVFPGSVHTPIPSWLRVRVQPTLARGRLRVPYKLLGSSRAFALHDQIVSRRIKMLAGQIDVIHTWPSGALRTLQMAKQLGIPTVLERPNAHTRFGYEVVNQECRRLGIALPAGDEHAYKPQVLRVEEEEFRLADRLLCASDFVVRTFLDKGFAPEKLARHQYGFDDRVFHPGPEARRERAGLTVLFAGVGTVVKGLHFALQAWLESPAHERGTFLIAGTLLPVYAGRLAQWLSQPSVRLLGHRNDVPELMRASDVLVLPSLTEGFGLVIAEAIGSGCVPLASDGCTEICRHMETGLVHHVGDVKTLSQQFTMLDGNRQLLNALRSNCLRMRHQFTWAAAGQRLLQVYRETVAAKRAEARRIA